MQRFEPLVKTQVFINAPADAVWDVMTHQTGVMFMGADVKTDWHKGHAITFKGKWKGKPYEDKGKVKKFEREKQLEFTHFSSLSGKEDKPEHYNLVTLVLKKQGDKTQVSVTQSIDASQDVPDHKTRLEYERNWAQMLDKLRQAAEDKVG